MKGNKATLSATHLKSVCSILFARLSPFDYPEAVLKHRLQIKRIFFLSLIANIKKNVNIAAHNCINLACKGLSLINHAQVFLFVKHGASLWKGTLAHFMIMLVKQILARAIGIQKDNCG